MDAILSSINQDFSTLSPALLEKYNTSGPRYTSYPTVPVWTEDFNARSYQKGLEDTNLGISKILPLSLYVHLPFCAERCLFCGCNVVITKKTEMAETYLDYLFREIEAVMGQVHPRHRVDQFHWGGGTPTYLSPEQMVRLFEFMRKHARFDRDPEVAIEVDPRVTTNDHLQTLAELGFNRISMGVQDFDPVVQQTINRIQPVAMTEVMVTQCRKLGFDSINFDLIYGLPFQTVESFSRTLDEVIRLSPDRLAVYNYAHVPWLSPHQTKIPESALPSGHEKFKIMTMAIQRLTEAGYIYIGLDHFAKPQDELTLALQRGTLHRNFMGYTVRSNEDSALIGFGVSSISGLPRHFAQNERKLSQYYQAVDLGHLPIFRGYALDNEDVLRRDIILSILCQGRLDFQQISSKYQVDFKQKFTQVFSHLEAMASDGLLQWQDNAVVLTPLGRVFSRNVAMLFDAYLKAPGEGQKPVFSKTL